MTNYRKKLLWLYARKRGSGSGGISVSVSGTTPVTLANAIESAIRHMTQHGKVAQTGTPTTANPVDIVCNNGALKWDSENQRIYADGTPEVITVSATGADPQTASVENLLAVGNVRDEQDIVTGKVTRRTEVFRYDGTQTVKPTFMSTTGGKDNGAIIVQPRGAEYAGDVVSFEAQEGKPIDSLIVTLTPKQEGTGDPSPENVRPITGTDAVEVVRCGKNLVNKADGKTSASNWWVGSVAVNDEPNGSFVLNAGTYTFSTSDNQSGLYARKNGANIAAAYNTTKLTFTLTERTAIRLSLYKSGVDASYWDTLDIQLELGSTATAFVPFDPLSTTLEVEWGDDVGTIYGGHLDAVRGEMVVTKASYTWDGSIPFTSQNGVFVNNKAGIRTRDASVASDKIVISNMFKSGGVGYRSECTDGSIIKVRGANTQIACYSSVFASVDDFNAYLAQHPMTMVYDLAQPITIPIDPQTLTALRNNTVWSEEGSVDVLLGDEVVELVAKQPLRTAEGDNTVSVISEVGEVDLAVTYKGGNS